MAPGGGSFESYSEQGTLFSAYYTESFQENPSQHEGIIIDVDVKYWNKNKKCSRHNKQMAFSDKKNIRWIKRFWYLHMLIVASILETCEAKSLLH